MDGTPPATSGESTDDIDLSTLDASATEDIDTSPLEVALAPTQRLRRAWRRHKLGVLGLFLTGGIILMALVGPIIYDVDPNLQALGSRLLPPGSESPAGYHLFGTDPLGRDMLARIFSGARASVGVVFAALIFGAGLGMTLGVLAGYYGGKLDTIVMRLVDAQLSIPVLVSAMFVAALLGTGFWNTALTLGIASWPIYARLIRADALQIRNQDFIEAGVALGASDLRLLGNHMMPNLISAISVVASLELGRMILVESALSFLGLGMQPPQASWGSMIRQGQDYVFNAWWLSTIPGLFIMVSVLGLNLLGDWLRDILDPHAK
jgi:peptide/nickel transport system permease protein